MRTEDVANFVVVADSPSLVAAAHRLGVSQPTLSKSIARLERALGAAVIERLPRGIAVTDAGRAFLSHAAPAAAGLRAGADAVRELRAGRAGLVRVGLGVSVPRTLVADALKRVLARGEVAIEILGGMSDTLSRAVAAGECDFAVTNAPAPGGPSIRWEPVFRDPMVPVVAATHPLAAARRVDWPTLARQRWVLPARGTQVRGWFEQLFVERGLPVPERTVSLRSEYASVPELGAALDAIGLTPASFLRADDALRRWTRLRVPGDWRSDREVGFVVRPGGVPGATARRVMECVRELGHGRFPPPLVRGAGHGRPP